MRVLSLKQWLNLRLADVLEDRVQQRLLGRLPHSGATKLLNLILYYFGGVSLQILEKQIR